jgi:hypothetical protein
MNYWILKDKIKRGLISYNIGDEVVCFHRKTNGYPRGIKDNSIYTIKNIDSDGHLHVAMRASDGVGFMRPIRVHKTYMINKSELRNIKLNYLFDETK